MQTSPICTMGSTLILALGGIHLGAAHAAGAVDTQPPALTRFAAPGSAVAGGELVVGVQASDNLSGFAGMEAHATSPTGQRLQVAVDLALPVRASREPAVVRVNRYQAPGVYTFDTAYARDAAGNYATYTAAALAALGPIEVTVRNPAGGDAEAPRLVAGVLLTPHLSLSARHPGTELPAYVKARVRLSDGGTQVSGVQNVALTFCPGHRGRCFTLFGSVAREAQAQATVTVAVQPALLNQDTGLSPIEPGLFQLDRVDAYDHAGNALFLWGRAFGGDTDFSNYFNSTMVLITP